MDNIKSVFRIIERISYILTPKQKRASIIVFISMVFCSFLELLGVSLIYPYLLIMMDESSMHSKWYLSWIYKWNPGISNTSILIIMGVAIATIYVIKNTLAILCLYIQADYSVKIKRELTVKMMNSYMIRPYEFFVNTQSSVIMRGLDGDVNSVYSIILNGFQVFAECLTIVMIVVYLIRVDTFIAVVSIVAGGVSFLIITLGFKGIMKKFGKESRGLAATIQGYSYQVINGIKEITVLDRKKCFVDTYDELAKRNANITKKTQVINAVPDRALEVACVVVVMFVLCIRISGGVDIQTFLPALGAFVMGIFRIMPSMAKLSGRINNIVYFLPGLDNSYEIARDAELIEKEFRVEEEKLAELVEKNNYNTLSFRNEIKVNNIYWKYKNSAEYVLKGLNLDVKRGESVGLIGSSGGGKSTLVDVLMTLFKPQSGSVTMDGVDIFLMKYRWRRLIGYVPQSVFLTADTIRNNVAFGINHEDISDDRVWHALDKAQLRSFVETLPHKLDTVVGERGVKLSGGQRQRIAIARALYDEPEILILDEATAALDNDTEKAFMESIEALQGEKTIILVAHRLTTVRNCDRVYEIKDGIAIERNVWEVVADI